MKRIYSCLALTLLFFVSLFPQYQTRIPEKNPSFSVSFSLLRSDSLYRLPHVFLEEESERVLLDSLLLLERHSEYEINYVGGFLKIKTEKLARYISDSLPHRLLVFYKLQPFSLNRRYSLRTVEITQESVRTAPTVRIAPSGTSEDDFFGSSISKSGSIVRGFTVGSNRDMSLTSGFRLQLSGKLAQDVDVTAALTDENSPLQPEGNTQTLREVDKVYVEIKHPRYEATLGDVLIEQKGSEGGEFAGIQRKILGAEGGVYYGNTSSQNFSGKTTVAVGTARGKYMTNQFMGIDGVQGPYRLRGKNGEQYLLVVAGSERVYLNGVLLTRGETNDYTIDYGSGEITFTSRQLITNASRIVVDFEYSDQQYARNLYALSTSNSIWNNALTVRATYRREADDPDTPIETTLSDSAKGLLRMSGADRYAAAFPGISFAGHDSASGMSLGQYLLADTVINGKHYTILVYAPGDPRAIYSVKFSPVAEVPKDSVGYIRVAVGQFRFAGIGEGNYMPLRFVPLPQSHDLMDIQATLVASSAFMLQGEYATSSFDANRLSALDASQKGTAVRFSAHYHQEAFRIGSVSLGGVELRYTKRYVASDFLPSDRLNEVEYSRKWNILSSLAADEDVNEYVFAYTPRQGYEGRIQYGTLEKSGIESSRRFQAEISLQDTLLPRTSYTVENIFSRSPLLERESRWERHTGLLSFAGSVVEPSVQLEAEKREATRLRSDSLLFGSFRFLDVMPQLSVSRIGAMMFRLGVGVRSEDSALAGSLHRAASAVTQGYEWQLNSWKNISASLVLSIRKNVYTEEFRKRGNLNSDVVLTRFTGSYSHPQRAIETQMYYEFSNQRSARLERIFLRVPKGTGNYTYLGDLNNNGIADENEYALVRFDGDYVVTTVAGEQLYPVADVKTSVRVRLRFGEIFKQQKLPSLLKAISTETYIRIDEKSSESHTANIFLLKPRYLLRPATTIAGAQQVLQDIFLYEGEREFSLRFRVHEKRGLSQYVSANEKTLYSEQSLRLESQLVSDIGNRTDIVHKRDKLEANVVSSRQRDVTATQLTSDFTYKPTNRVEVGFVVGVSQSTNAMPENKADADINTQTLRVIYSFPMVGQIRIELTREDVALQGKNLTLLPYELTEGKAVGKSYLWSGAFDYRIGNNIQCSAFYQGRIEGKSRIPVHTLRAEVRAFF